MKYNPSQMNPIVHDIVNINQFNLLACFSQMQQFRVQFEDVANLAYLNHSIRQ